MRQSSSKKSQPQFQEKKLKKQLKRNLFQLQRRKFKVFLTQISLCLLYKSQSLQNKLKRCCKVDHQQKREEKKMDLKLRIKIAFKILVQYLSFTKTLAILMEDITVITTMQKKGQLRTKQHLRFIPQLLNLNNFWLLNTVSLLN